VPQVTSLGGIQFSHKMTPIPYYGRSLTKSNLAQFIADKLQKTDQGSLNLIKSFIDRRYEMIWNSAIWRESLGTTSYSVSADTEEVTLNAAVQFPIAASWDDEEITPIDYSAVFRTDPKLFSETGKVANFIVLPNDSSGQAKIRLLRKPKEAKTLLVLGKVFHTVLTDDHRPEINGVDNALLCFVEGDMLEHLRQYQKAQIKFQEASAQLMIVKDMETHQSASDTRIIPQVEASWDLNDFSN